MPDPRASYPDSGEHQARRWLSELDHRPTYGSVAALPLPTEQHRDRATYEHRLAFLRMLAEPGQRSRGPRAERG